jgi:hypothetical protein
MSRKHTSHIAVGHEHEVGTGTKRASRETAIGLIHFVVRPMALLITTLQVASLLEEDARGTFFIAYAGNLMFCRVCEATRVISSSQKVGQLIYCRGRKLFGRHKEEKMIPMNNRGQGTSGHEPGRGVN